MLPGYFLSYCGLRLKHEGDCGRVRFRLRQQHEKALQPEHILPLQPFLQKQDTFCSLAILLQNASFKSSVVAIMNPPLKMI
uniref:Uncharacterized protein n=1 Tax=Kuenenia stuttgartiensis TaxID=174633 RepID=Q1PXC1_KUEST|nr:unknown protein [Candidatus Kuenenia stuttgartiensis]